MKNDKRMTIIRLSRDLPNLEPYELSQLMTKLKSLSRAHHKQCENSCNGRGYIGRQCYTLGTVQGTPHNIKSGYVDLTRNDSQTVFDTECDRLEDKMRNIMKNLQSNGKLNNIVLGKFEFQGDPRGATVKLVINGHTYCPAWDF